MRESWPDAIDLSLFCSGLQPRPAPYSTPPPTGCINSFPLPLSSTAYLDACVPQLSAPSWQAGQDRSIAASSMGKEGASWQPSTTILLPTIQGLTEKLGGEKLVRGRSAGLCSTVPTPTPAFPRSAKVSRAGEEEGGWPWALPRPPSGFPLQPGARGLSAAGKIW